MKLSARDAIISHPRTGGLQNHQLTCYLALCAEIDDLDGGLAMLDLIDDVQAEFGHMPYSSVFPHLHDLTGWSGTLCHHYCSLFLKLPW